MKKKKPLRPPLGERSRAAAEEVLYLIGLLRDACEELYNLREEYESWWDSQPENSALAEKLEAICDNLNKFEEPDFDTLESAAQECLDACQDVFQGTER